MKKILLMIAVFSFGLHISALLLTAHQRIRFFEGYPGSHYPFYSKNMAIEQKALFANFFSTNQYIHKAEILFIGNSRMQTAFIPSMLDNFFSVLNMNYYMLACGHNEKFLFYISLIEHLDLRDKTIVVNIESFFNSTMSSPAKEATTWPVPFVWLNVTAQYLYDAYISFFYHSPPLYRSIERGTWQLESTVRIDKVASHATYKKHGVLKPITNKNIGAFIKFSRKRNLNIIFVFVPTIETDISIENAKSISNDYDIPLILVDTKGFATYDHSHLNRSTAINFSTQFFKKISPLLKKAG